MTRYDDLHGRCEGCLQSPRKCKCQYNEGYKQAEKDLKKLKVGEWVDCKNCHQPLNRCPCPTKTAEPKCEGCGKKPEACMCRTTTPADHDEVRAERNRKITREMNPTFADRLKETAKINLENKTRDGANDLVSVIKLAATKAADEGRFELRYHIKLDEHSWAAAELAAKILTDVEGFKAQVIRGSDFYSSGSTQDYINVDWL